MTRTRRSLLAVAAALLLVAGCGTSHPTGATRSGASGATTATTATTAGGTTGGPSTTTAPTTTAPSMTTVPSTTTVPASTTTTVASLRATRWADIRVPASVCAGTGSIRLRGFKARIPAPPALHAGTADALVFAGPVMYGQLAPGRDAAALYVWCDNTGGTADGQRQSSWVIYVRGRSGPRPVGILSPRQPHASAAPHVPYFDGNDGNIAITPGRIVVHELWYAASDGTCCPSIRAVTVWRYHGGRLEPVSTTT